MFSAITVAPENTLVVRCEDKYANMTCESNKADDIVWTYDDYAEIYVLCRSNSPDVFLAKPNGTMQCDIAASMEGAALNDRINSISGPYGCKEFSSGGGGVSATSLVIALGTYVPPFLAFSTVHAK